MSSDRGQTTLSLPVLDSSGDVALTTHVENLDAPGLTDRRGFLKSFMAVSAALAVGVPGCARKPPRQIVSRVQSPEYQKPGKPLYYSSTWTEGTHPYGLIIKTVDGRPIKIEGNPDHPLNGDASNSAMQASLLSLYDPDRLTSPRQGGSNITWEEADTRIIEAIRQASSVLLVTRSTLGPTERNLLSTFRDVHPNVHHVVHEAVNDVPRRTAHQTIYGEDGEVIARLDRAEIIVSLDCDFLCGDGAVIENIGAFAKGRRVDDAAHADASIGRLYVAEGAMTLTGSNADHRIPLRPSAMGALALAMLRALEGDTGALTEFASECGIDAQVLHALVKDLSSHRGTSVIMAGPHLPASVHATVALLNDLIDAPGKTLQWNPTPSLPVTDPADVRDSILPKAEVVIFLGVNPLYDAPHFWSESALSNASLVVGHGLHADETVSACHLSLPSHHYLESWNDASPRPGVASLCQPVTSPLFDSRQEAETLLTWIKGLAPENDAIHGVNDLYDYLRHRWKDRGASHDDPDRRWQEHLRAGGVFEPVDIPFPDLDRVAAESLVQSGKEHGDYELLITPHHALHDGRFAHNGWLQELPDPVSKLVWDNACAISPATASTLSVGEGDVLNVSVGGASVDLPVLIQPGMADGVLVTTLGHGRWAGSRMALEAGGTNAAVLLGHIDASSPRLATDVTLSGTARTRKLVRTQREFSMHDRPIVLDGTLDEYHDDPSFVDHKRHLPEEADLYPPVDYSKGHKWGMAIDLGSCVGCEACMISCQAENNIPIVGRDQCEVGREMHWIRLDRYHEGDPDNPSKVHHQPMLCQHCDNAPCENVCPVNATAHSPEGLNEMVYNRCVGTRYCANNCPYKVRRFNFLRYQDAQLREPIQELLFNPQVTVRGVGVMEKCSFCVQRITAAKFEASNSDSTTPDGTIRTACEQACPANAIVFGDLNDPDSRVAKMRASGRSFHVLEQLNVKPNVSYLAQVRNPSPSIPSHDEQDHGRTGSHEA